MAKSKTPQLPGKETKIDQQQILIASGQAPATSYSLTHGRVNYQVQGANSAYDFFGPQQPILPVAQDQAWGRQFDYPAGVNTRVTPRLEEAISFDQLKAIADGYDVLRTIIERCKDLHAAQNWTIGPKDEEKDRDARCDEVEDFFQSPDRQHTWAEWLRMLLEQLFVLDAVSIVPTPTRGGGLYSLELIDGATIRRVLDDTGRTPLPPDPAYQQIIKGLPAVDYSIGQLIYKPRNLRVHKIYGYGPVEQIVTTVNIALHRQMYQLKYYTEGTTPDLIFQVPETWNPDQIKSFRDYWLSMLQGNLDNRRGAMFVPNGVKPYDTKEKALKDDYDEWLIRICCFAFSVSPTPFIKSMNRASAQSHHEQAIQEGLEPIQHYIKDLINSLIVKFFGYKDLTLRWTQDEAIDPLEQAQIDEIYLTAKVYHPDEIRQRMGDDPMESAMRLELDEPDFSSSGNATVTPTGQAAAPDPNAENPRPQKLAKGSKKKLKRLTKTARLY